MTNFEKMNEKELLQAYRGYLKMAKTGAVGEDDFDGLFRRAIDEQSKEHPGRGVINATQDLLAAIANRWFEEHSQAEEVLVAGTEVWYVNKDEGCLEHGVVETVYYKEGNLDSIGVNFPDSNDYDVFDGSALGRSLFRSELQAKERLTQ